MNEVNTAARASQAPLRGDDRVGVTIVIQKHEMWLPLTVARAFSERLDEAIKDADRMVGE